MYLYVLYDLINIATLARINMVFPFLALERTKNKGKVTLGSLGMNKISVLPRQFSKSLDICLFSRAEQVLAWAENWANGIWTLTLGHWFRFFTDSFLRGLFKPGQRPQHRAYIHFSILNLKVKGFAP